MRIVFIVLFSCFFCICKGQITVANKSFESQFCNPICSGGINGPPTCNNICNIFSYYNCEIFFGILNFSDTTLQTTGNPKNAFKGIGAIKLNSKPNFSWGSVSTQLPCSLKKGREYSFGIALVGVYYVDYFINNNGDLDSTYYIATSPQNINIWGNSDSCARQEVIWQSPVLDTAWHKYTAILAPKERDYEFIHFRLARIGTLNNPGDWSAMMDDLSDIYPYNAHAFDSSGLSRDTVVHVGQCVPLTATPSITTYDSVAWYKITQTGRVKLTNGFNTTVCPTENSTYLIAMRDTVPDCAGIWWSFDTVRVTVDTSVSIRNISKAKGYEVQLAPNPVQSNIQLQILHDRVLIHEPIQFQLIDMLGRVAFTREVNNEEIIDLSTLPQGVYSVAVRVRDLVWVSKVVKQ